MLPQHVLPDLDTPARSDRHAKLTVCDLGHLADQVVAPGDVVDVVLEDPRVWNDGTPLRGDERREVRVVVVRGAVDLEGLREVGDLLRLVEAVPDDIHGGDVHASSLEIRPEVAAPVEVLARADRHRRDMANVRESPGVEEIHLEPEEVELVEGPCPTHASLRLE